MSKAPSPLLGYNNNVRHKSRVFHIQTEDSGVKHPHIITHLFMDGGRILKSVKKSYADHLGSEGLESVVRQMMKEQHKAMFIALRGGHFDHLVDAAADTQPGSVPSSAKPSRPVSPPSDPGTARTATTSAPPSQEGGRPLTTSAPPMSGLDVKPPVSAPETVRMPSSPAGPEPSSELTLDIDALEPGVEPPPPPAPPVPASEPQKPAVNNDLAPPLFKKRADSFRFQRIPGKETRATAALLSTASTASAGAPPVQAKRVSPVPEAAKWPEPSSSKVPDTDKSGPPSSSRGGGKATAPPPSAPATEGRYAPARPAAIFGHARPQQGSSIFGEDLISDKSLDEVILSYLAEDLESDKK